MAKNNNYVVGFDKNDEKTSRFEVGDFEVLGEIKNRLKMYPATLKIFIVQPGVAGDVITDDMNQVLMASKTYLQETYGIEMGMICNWLLDLAEKII